MKKCRTDGDVRRRAEGFKEAMVPRATWESSGNTLCYGLNVCAPLKFICRGQDVEPGWLYLEMGLLRR